MCLVLPKTIFSPQAAFLLLQGCGPLCSCRAAGCERTPRPASCKQFEGEVTGVYFHVLALQVYEMPVLPSILIKMSVFNCFPPSTIFLLYPACREVKTDSKGAGEFAALVMGELRAHLCPQR